MSARFAWRGVEIEVLFERNWLNSDTDHIEVHTEPRTPLPITETGYRSHFIASGELADAVEAAEFVQRWLEAEGKDWDGQLALL